MYFPIGIPSGYEENSQNALKRRKMQSKIIKHGGKNVNFNGNAAHGECKHDNTDTKSPGDRHESQCKGRPDMQESSHAYFLEDKVHAKDDSLFYGAKKGCIFDRLGAREGCVFDRLGVRPCSSRYEGKHENLDEKSGLGNSSIGGMHPNWDERHREGHSQEFKHVSEFGPSQCGRGRLNAEEVKALLKSVESQSKRGGGGMYRDEHQFSGGERCGFRGGDSESGPSHGCGRGRLNAEEVKALLKSVESRSKCGGGMYRGEDQFSGGERCGFRGGGRRGFRGGGRRGFRGGGRRGFRGGGQD